MNFLEIKRKVKNRLWRKYVKDVFYHQRLVTPPIIQNLNFCYAGQKKVLLCYLTSFQNHEWDTNSKGRTQPYEIFAMIRVFSQLGYTVDVIDSYDLTAVKYLREKKYDLIFGFGESFYQLTQLQPSACSILYMTENHPEISLREEKKRLDYFQLRHRKKPPLSRSGQFYKPHQLEKRYSEVVVLGETAPFEASYEKPYTLFPTGIFNEDFKPGGKVHAHARKHFLWLGSYGAIHKGLDLLLDVFSKRSDITLHIGGLKGVDRKFLIVPNRSNIIDYGHIDIHSNHFLEIACNCSYIILPSCSEAFATSITTGMLHGLIPIVMRNAGFNRLADHAIFLDNYSLEYLNHTLTAIAEKDEIELKQLSKDVLSFAHENFTVCAFERSFKKLMETICV